MNILLIAGIVLIIILIYFYVKSYKIRYDTIIAFSGGLGSGKSFLSVKYAIKLTKKQRLKVRIRNLFKKQKNELPKLYTNIPVLLDKNNYSVELTKEHLLLNAKIIPKSVVLLDEVDSFASQFEYNEKNIKETFNEFVRLFRHYTLGGYLIVNSQCSDNIVLQIRRRINSIYNLMNFQTFFIFYRVRVRCIDISEEIKSVADKDKQEDMTYLYGILPRKKHYDTYCYSNRYNSVPCNELSFHKQLKTNQLTQCPKEIFTAKTNSDILPLKAVKTKKRFSFKKKN